MGAKILRFKVYSLVAENLGSVGSRSAPRGFRTFRNLSPSSRVAAIPRRRLPSWSRRLSAARGSSGVGTLLRFRVWEFRALGFRVSI